MARQTRFALAGVPQHVVQRGNNRQATFVCEADYLSYLDYLSDAADEYDCAIHAYVLMPNHVHLLVTCDFDAAISRMMQHLGRRYVRLFNTKYGRSGTLWEGRFKASLVDTDRYLLTCHRYIEMNPVRARIVDKPQDYRWSSYRCNALGANNSLVRAHDIYTALAPTDEGRRQAYRQIFDELPGAEELQRIRRALETGWPLGGDRFLGKIEHALQRPARPGRRRRPESPEQACPGSTARSDKLLRPRSRKLL